jgi:MIP family channel proteins
MSQTTEREALAEFFGTLILIAFGAGVVAQTVLSRNTAGSILSINIGWGLAVMLGIYSAVGVSGAHLNPAVTLALALRRGFPWRKVPLFVLAQIAGAFAGAALVWLTYHDALNAFDGGVRHISGELGTAGIFATYPQAFLSPLGGVVDQVVGTALLMAGVLAVTDQRNTAPPAWLGAPLVGGLVLAIGVAFGFNSGYAINPARDLGPRLLTAVAGWGPAVFTASHAWAWVPVVAPCVGAVAGALAYDACIGRSLPREK